MMGRQHGKRIAAFVVCLTLLLSAGCSKVKEEDDRADQSRTKAGTQERAGNTGTGGDEDRKEGKTLKQASVPQFIPNGIRSVSLTKDGEEFLHISREPAEYKMQFDYWEILNPYDENATMNTEVMFEMFQELCGITFEMPAEVLEGVDTGIEDSDMGYRVEYVDTLDDSVAKSTDEADTTAEVILGKEDGNGGRYAAVAGNEEQVYVLQEAALQMIFGRKPFDYILKIPVLISAETLEDIEITADGSQFLIQVDAAKDSYRFGKKEVEKKEFAALYQLISGVGLVSEMEGERSSGKDEPHLVVRFHRNMEGAPDVSVCYYAFDDEFDSVEIDGVERFLVRKEDVEAVIGGIEENVFNYN